MRSNQPVPELSPYKIEWIAASRIAKLLVGLLLAKAIWGKSIDVNLGLSEILQQKRQRLTRLGWRLALGGVGGLILFTFIYVAVMLSGGQDSTGDVLIYIPLLLSFVALAGLPVLVVAYFPMLQVKKWAKDYIWLKGANPELLASLSEWKGGPLWKRGYIPRGKPTATHDFAGIKETNKSKW
jgi:hypothetical protein